MIEAARKIPFLLTRRQRRGALVLLALMVVGMILETLCTGLVIPAIALITQRDLAASYPQLGPLLGRLGNPSHADLIVMTMAALVGVYLVKNLFLGFLAWGQTRYAHNAQVELSQRLFALYLRQPYIFHLQRNSAQLIRNITTEVTMFSAALINALMLATELLVVAGIAALLLVIEPVGALATVTVLGGAAWVFHRGTRARVATWSEKRQHHDALRLQHLQQGLSGAKDVKLLGREQDFLVQHDFHNVHSARMNQFQAALQQMPRLWLELMAVIGLATLVIAMLSQGREIEAIVPTLGLFAAAAFRLMPSVNRTLAAAQYLRYCTPSIHTLYEEVKLGEPGIVAGNTRRQRAFQSEIRAENVTFTYPAAPKPALSGLSLHVRRGEAIGLVGQSGSGKSTLVDVILGLLAPQTGRVVVDGQDIQSDLRAWQDQIGYVPQSIYLTDDSLRRNIAFGIPQAEIDEVAVRRALRAAQLEEFVENLPAGLDTVVGERGVRLSGGQRQRIGIARALYHDPAILVLDEATSALDTATEAGVMEAVKALQGLKTIIIVAHRISTVAHCARLYRLEHGRLTADTSPWEQAAESPAMDSQR